MPAAAYQPAANCAHFSLDAVHEYFAQLNPIAQRIACDIKQTQSTYGHLWCTLNAHEQNDIINETLINPEIALRYFDNFASSSTGSSTTSSRSDSNSPTPSSASAQSNVQMLALQQQQQQQKQQQRRATTSSESLTTAVLKHSGGVKLGPGKLKPPNEPPPPPPVVRRPSQPNTTVRSCYAFDGRHLRTYALQKVALKFVHDEVLGAYRDEHAAPFSYRTKSQIDLPQQCATPAPDDDDEVCLLPCSQRPMRSTLSNYQKLQQELKQNLSPIGAGLKNVNIKTIATVIPTANAFPLNKPLILPSKPPAAVVCSPVMEKTHKTPNYQAPKALSYAIYADGYYERGESANLMSHSGNLTASSSSANTSDDEERQRYAEEEDDDDDDDEKTLCEDVKLLDNDSSLRKGFDFLNNW